MSYSIDSLCSINIQDSLLHGSSQFAALANSLYASVTVSTYLNLHYYFEKVLVHMFSFLEIVIVKHLRYATWALYEGNPSVTIGIPSQMAIVQAAFPCHIWHHPCYTGDMTIFSVYQHRHFWESTSTCYPPGPTQSVNRLNIFNLADNCVNIINPYIGMWI